MAFLSCWCREERQSRTKENIHIHLSGTFYTSTYMHSLIAHWVLYCPMAGHKQQPGCRDVIKRAEQCAANNSGLVGLSWGWKVALWSWAHIPFFFIPLRGNIHFSSFYLLCVWTCLLSTIFLFPILTPPEPLRFPLCWACFCTVNAFLNIFIFRAVHWLQCS